MFVAGGREGVGDVFVEELTALVAATFGDTPAHELARAGQNLSLTSGILMIAFFITLYFTN